jgi:hypothetical protein
MKSITQTRNGATKATRIPAKAGTMLENHLQFDPENMAKPWCENEFQALLVQPGPNEQTPWMGAKLFLANVEGYCRDSYPLSGFEDGDIKEATLAEACSWYARCNPIFPSSTGSVEILCRMAADALRGASQ